MRYLFAQWVEVWQLDSQGFKLVQLPEFTNLYTNTENVSITIEKSITSNADTATVILHNHPLLERIYNEKYMFFKEFFKHDYEVDIVQWYRSGHEDKEIDTIRCIFTGDLDNLTVRGNVSVTDQAIELSCMSGSRMSTRVIHNTTYDDGVTAREIIEDIFNLFPNYELTTIDDPEGKLDMPYEDGKTFHGKAVDSLNEIAKNLDMTWGFDANPWLLQDRLQGSVSTSESIKNPKRCYFVDKQSIFDTLGDRGTKPYTLFGATGKLGRIGYTKAQFTVDHLYEPLLNIGNAVSVSDFGTMKNMITFEGRINRMTINNNLMNMECQYIDPETGLAVLDNDGNNTGALVL